MKLWEAVLNLLFPPCCPVCGKLVGSAGSWHDACLEPLLHPHQIKLSPWVQKEVRAGYALGAYQGVVRRLLLSVKYNGKKHNLLPLQIFVQRAMEVWEGEALTFDVAVPVPLHVKRERQRGYNQAALLFMPWLQSRESKTTLLPALCRTKNTPLLSTLGAEERVTTLHNAFALREGMQAKVHQKRVLLLDDIMTTGATAFYCARALRQGGAREVQTLALVSGK